MPLHHPRMVVDYISEKEPMYVSASVAQIVEFMILMQIVAWIQNDFEFSFHVKRGVDDPKLVSYFCHSQY